MAMKNFFYKYGIGIILGLGSLLISNASISYANNLSISNVSLETRDSTLNTAVVEFDISWDNSWRNTENHDAVWIVAKEILLNSSEPYHFPMYTSGLDPTDTSPGSNEDLEIYIPSDKTGAFIRRKSTGSGTVTSSNVRLTLNYNSVGATDASVIQVKLLAMEMVYIPQREFFAGDTAGTAAFANSAGTQPWYIGSEATISVAGAGSYYYRSTTSADAGNEYSTGATFTIPALYPKGYQPFYCMKYEITEGQWVDFFNLLKTDAKTNRDITSATGKNSDSVVKRNTISWSGSGSASTTRSDRVMNYITWMDMCAFLDWMGLRPMTELEYEKIARGPNSPVSAEYAWGSTSITAAVTISISPESGLETISTASANANYNVTTFSRGDDFLGAQYVQGPLRSGIFATSSSTRATSGAGYYGVMELSGNLAEWVVTVGNTEGVEYTGEDGDGVLVVEIGAAYAGNAEQDQWPGRADGSDGTGVESLEGSGIRGGGWSNTSGSLQIRDRSEGAIATYDIATGNSRVGGRGVRDDGGSDFGLP